MIDVFELGQILRRTLGRVRDEVAHFTDFDLDFAVRFVNKSSGATMGAVMPFASATSEQMTDADFRVVIADFVESLQQLLDGWEASNDAE